MGLGGCGKSETPPSPPSRTVPAEPRATAKQPTQVTPAPEAAPEPAKLPAPSQAPPETQSAVADAAAKLSQEVESLLGRAKSLLAEKKVQDAAGLLSKLSGMALSANQNQTLSSLKTEFSQTAEDIDKGFSALKSLIAEKKYTEATSLVVKLKDYQLSSEQQSVYDGLKAQLQKALGNQAAEEAKKVIGTNATEEARKALGGLLPGK